MSTGVTIRSQNSYIILFAYISEIYIFLKYGTNPLVSALIGGHTQMVRLLLDYGANTEVVHEVSFVLHLNMLLFHCYSCIALVVISIILMEERTWTPTSIE